MVGSTECKAKIRSWFKKEYRPENITHGQELLIAETERQGYRWKEITSKNHLDDVRKYFNNISKDDLFAAAGYGGLSVKTIVLKLIDFYKKDLNEQKITGLKTSKDFENLRMRSLKKRVSNGILVKGEDGLVVHLSKCCNPVPGDEIIGYVTRGRGVSVHRTDCPNAINLSDKDRTIEVEWEQETSGMFLVTIEVIAYDRTGLMADILAVLMELKLSVSTANVKVENTGMAGMNLGIQIKDLQQLEFIMTKIRRIKGVHSVHRMRSSRGG